MLVLALFVLVSGQDCSFTLPGGEIVDLSSLRNTSPPDYEVYAGDGYIYRANICGPVSSACEGDSSAVATQWTSYSSCISILGRMYDIWGTSLPPKVAYLDASDPNKGFSLTYSGGDYCFNMMSYIDRSVTFNFNCDSAKGSFTDASESTTLCQYTYNFKTKLACVSPSKSDSAALQAAQSQGLSRGSKFLLVLFVASLLYCGLGIAYNKYTGDMSIVESIPHKDFWMEIPALAGDGISFTLTKVKSGFESVKGQSHEPI